jgi:hypothetical protein
MFIEPFSPPSWTSRLSLDLAQPIGVMPTVCDEAEASPELTIALDARQTIGAGSHPRRAWGMSDSYSELRERYVHARRAADAARSDWEQFLPTQPLESGQQPPMTQSVDRMFTVLQQSEANERAAREALFKFLRPDPG